MSLDRVGNQRIAHLAADIEPVADALARVLDPARCDHLAPVSPAQLRVLTLLRAQPALNVNGLAAALQVGASSASRLCDRLEALGLVVRAPDPRDRREVKLLLTAPAVELLETLTRFRRHTLETVLAAMPPSSRQELARALTAFNDAVEHAAVSAEATDGEIGVADDQRRSA
jgi:DNA-binding MarR family transcriptional regulator